MKQFYLIILIISFSQIAQAQRPFITTWETTTPNESITIPTEGDGYDYTVDWGDGEVISDYTGDATHEYASPGIYTVKINGVFPQIFFINSGDKDKIKSIEQWGDLEWRSMERAFSGCINLEGNANDKPDLSKVELLIGMFQDCESFNQAIGDWNVSNVSNMLSMFLGASTFNQDIGSWDVSNVINMSNMFGKAKAFNQDIGDWDMSRVESVAYMFYDAESFNQDIGDWNMSNVLDMYSLFFDAKSFNQDISSWDVSNVNRMGWMFAYAQTFNQNISSWDVRKVTSMTEMLSWSGLNTINYDKTLEGWSQLETLQPNVVLGSSNLKLCQSASARQKLIDEFGWVINGDSQNCQQIITFEALEVKTFGDSVFILNATTNSGLDVIYTSGNPSVATIAGNVVTVVGAGISEIIASQPGNEYFESASAVQQQLKVNRASQVITFEDLEDKTLDESEFTLSATTTSGLEVSYFSNNPLVATIAGNVVTLKGAGTTLIKATQNGNDNYIAAIPITHELTVNRILNNNQEINHSLLFYPNPVKSHVNIESSQKIEKVSLFDLNGSKLMDLFSRESGDLKLDFSEYPAGIYFLKVNDSSQMYRLVKQ